VWLAQLGEFSATHPTGDLATAIDACTDKLQHAVNTCTGADSGGAGGEGGRGQSGAGAGGHGGA